ncbi:MAG: rRNA pseudouridine synthase [Rickettsiaceae bacterium H1]|nr:rRNA pseudouridine synthase [Rickettsiaceae bacterium H1]
MRLNKYIAHSGYCSSRRSADKLISEGKVTFNGQSVTDFNIVVNENDEVKIDGKKLSLPNLGVWLYYKPIRVITSKKDEQGRKTVFDHLPNNLKNLISVGRLDFNSEGLLLMTNNGDFAKFMTDPKNKILRKYKIRAFGKIKQDKLELIKQGITLDNIRYQPINIQVIDSKKNNSWFHIALTEGKNREIRNIFAFLELKIDRLIRTDYGIFSLGNLKPNEIVAIPNNKLKIYTIRG